MVIEASPRSDREAAPAARPTVLIYRNELLRPTETFIAAQVNALQGVDAAYVGLLAAESSLALDHPAVLAYPRRVFSRVLTKLPYQATGVAPGFHRRVRALGGDLLHIHFATDAVMALPLIEALGLPTLVTLHGYDVSVRDEVRRRQVSGRLYLRGRPALWARVDRFLCVSEFIRERALQAGFPENKLLVHHIGINREAFRPRDVPREPLVLFVGRLVEKKGCEYLLRAMKIVQQTLPHARLAVIGEGPLAEPLQALARDLGVAVQFLGRQPGAEVRQWLARAQVLAVPSVTARSGDSEGLPTVIMEAHAMGLPVVGFRHAGIPEIVEHGVTGLLSREGDVDSLASGLVQFTKDATFWARASGAAIERVARSFDLPRQTAELEGLYRQMIASPAISGRAASRTMQRKR